jgi:beta-lactamase regulating signal transducer with metallopeptidase domain
MTALLVKATVAMVGALALVVMARRSRASVRHLILTALFVFLLVLPAVQSIAPALQIPVPSTTLTERIAPVAATPQPAAAGTNGAGVTAAPTGSFHWVSIAVRVYLFVAAFLLVSLAIGVMRLRRMANRAEVWLEGTARMNEIAHEANIRRSALVVASPDVAVPLTFGFRRSTIVVPDAAREWSADELTRALRHELEHVRREDWLLQLAARVACAVYWPHPLVWTAWRRFCLEAERACDDAVIGFSEPAAYAGQLVSLARQLRGFAPAPTIGVPALGMASRSKLAQRVNAILDPTQRRGPHGQFSAAVVLMLLLVLIVGVAPARLIAAVTEATQSEFNPNPDFDFNVDPDPDRSPYGELLVKLAEKGEIERLQKLFDSGVDVNTVSLGDGTALIGAARAGRLETIEFLLDQNADPNVTSRGDGSPLIAAAEGGHVEIVKRLLDAGAHIDEIVPGDENPLMGASWQGQAEVVRLLIDRGADVNAETYADGELRSPLILARRGGNAEVVKMLIAAGAKE